MTDENALEQALAAVDQSYIVKIRREIHEYPELQFDLPRTIGVVKRELEKLGIEYTEEYGKSSVVATINPQKKDFTIGIRADMDALPLTEMTNLPFKSKNEGKMHACGHDAHTAMLLGTAKALNAVKEAVACRIKLIFQPYEEGVRGAVLMVEDGVMDDIDIIIGMHVENWLDSGCIGVCPGESMAASNPITIRFNGKAAHATLPHTGCDALAMAVDAYINIQMMLTREIDPFKRYVCSVSAINAGKTHNVIAETGEMKISLRTYEVELNDFMENRIKEICKNAAEMRGGTYQFEGGMAAYPIVNDPVISQAVLKAAEKVVGKENIVQMRPKMSSEDFSQYLRKKPGVFFRLGTRNEAKGCNTLPHNNDFLIDEDAFEFGSKTCIQFVFDSMYGIERSL